MRYSSAILAAGLIAGLGSAASAQTDGWYFGAEAGANIAPRIHFDANSRPWSEQQDTGYALLGQVGYGFGPIRLEGELGWRHNDISSITNYQGEPASSGAIKGLNFMANALYDFNTGTKWTPYVGAGVGGINLSTDHITAANTEITNDNELLFAYQGIAGVSYALNNTLSIKADYHYMRTEKANLSLNSAYDSGDGKGTYAAHTILVGFTVKFPPSAAPAPTPAVAPPPPPPAPPAPPPAPKPVQAAPIAKNFMVFFDFDKDALTPEAKAIITQAADAAKKNHSTTLALTGYTDLSGSVPYNQKLSERRGESVKKMLVQLGIPANEISVVGKGKSDPLVPTKDGVREPQNRRVTIVLE